MATTPLAAIHAHTAAFNSQDGDALVATIHFSLVHFGTDDQTHIFETAADRPERGAFRFETPAIQILAASGEVVLYAVTMQPLDDAGHPSGPRIQGLWAVHRVDDERKVGWRQFLGEV